VNVAGQMSELFVAIAAVLSLVVIGLPICRLVDPSATRGKLIGESFFLGCGAIVLAMLLLSQIGVRWSMPSTMITLAIVLLPLVMRRRFLQHFERYPSANRRAWLALPFDGALVLLLIGYAVYATLATPWEWDYWAIWGLKGKVFHVAGGVDWRFLRDPSNEFAHPDYPPMLPLLFNYFSLYYGEWHDRWIGLLYAGFAAAALLVVRDELREESSRVAVSIATVALSGVILQRWIGMGEGPLIALMLAGLAVLRSGSKKEDRSGIMSGSLLLGLAALVKNEGLAMLLAATAATIFLHWRRPRLLLALVPGFLIVAPWYLLRLMSGLQTELFAGDAAARLLQTSVSEIIGAIAGQVPERPWYWVAALASCLLFIDRAVTKERLLSMVLILFSATLIGAYFVTPYDSTWHVVSSWRRVVWQAGAVLFLLAVCLLLPFLPREEQRKPIPASAE
jgi:hypothetical protein